MAPLTRVFALIALASTAAANINFTWVQPKCTPGTDYTGCLRGQNCVDGSCVAEYDAKHLAPAAAEKRSLTEVLSREERKLQRRQYRPDGRCGPNFGNAPCDPAIGTCCSAYG